MATFSNSTPTMAEIGAAQNNERNLRRQMAKDYWYTSAKRWHLSGAVLTTMFALSAPLVLLYQPSWGPTLGAIAGAWIFVSRLLLEPWKLRLQAKGAEAQELFDCDVLGLAWNQALVREPAPEEIRKASSRFTDKNRVEKHRDWYPTDVSMKWPTSVLTCQRSNAVWARREHHSYGLFLVYAAAVWAIVGIAVSVSHQASLAEYLTTIGLPSLPAMLDATELSRKHFRAASKRQLMEDDCNDLISEPSAVEYTHLREIQDQLLGLRRDAPLVAGWFYRSISESYEEDMRYAAKQQSDEEPS